MKKFIIGFICGWLVMANYMRHFLLGENLVQGGIEAIKTCIRGEREMSVPSTPKSKFSASSYDDGSVSGTFDSEGDFVLLPEMVADINARGLEVRHYGALINAMMVAAASEPVETLVYASTLKVGDMIYDFYGERVEIIDIIRHSDGELTFVFDDGGVMDDTQDNDVLCIVR